jgi:hypothetical protein
MFADLLEFLEIENIYSKHASRKSVPLSTSLCLYFNYVTIRCFLKVPLNMRTFQFGNFGENAVPTSIP